jgi:DNA-binding transcriptional LysR family regulator
MSEHPDLRAINLNLLPALEALMAERQVSAAARRAGISQSAMSHALAKLRLMFDDPLLVVAGREMVPTPRGERIAAALPGVLGELSAIIAPPKVFDPHTARNTFTLATLDFFELTTISHVFAYFQREAPGVSLCVERWGTDSVERMRSGDIDLLITGTSARLPVAGLCQQHLFDDRFAIIVRKEHPLTQCPLTLERYAQAEHVVVSVERRASGVVDRRLAEYGLTRRIVLRVPHFVSAPLAVIDSDLVCTIANSVAERARELFGVQVLQLPFELPSAGVVAMWPRQHQDDPARTWFREAICSGRALSPLLQTLVHETCLLY